MHKLVVELGERSYPILIGAGMLANAELFEGLMSGQSAVVVTNETVAPLYLPTLTRSLRESGRKVMTIVLPDGEMHKTAQTLHSIYDSLMQNRCDRSTTLVALGGGVIGDLCGYAAATYQRGVPFVQVPTTLLAQVDSSVGGKTGINHPLGKNMIGAFWQPQLVVADTNTLKTLPERELSAGLAEVIKYGLIGDVEFFVWLEENMESLRACDSVALAYAVERSCANKAAVVASDERETAKENGRALLNLGHTFGHAIETGLGYGKWLHGEAVAAGTIMAAELSKRLGWLSQSDLMRIEKLYERAGLPLKGPRLGRATYLDLMGHDKKNIGGQLRLVLLKRIGEAVTHKGVDQAEIEAVIDTCCDDHQEFQRNA